LTDVATTSGNSDTWQIAELGFACVGNSEHHVSAVLDTVARFIEETRPDLVILDTFREYLDV